jgi:rhodanese-related sulfurtransferase
MSLASSWTEGIKLEKLLDSSKPTLCLCKVGQRSFRAASFLGLYLY